MILKIETYKRVLAIIGYDEETWYDRRHDKTTFTSLFKIGGPLENKLEVLIIEYSI